LFRSSHWLLGSLLLVAPVPSGAVPILQLDIAGGRYDAASQSIVTSAESFTLHAYAAPQRGARLAKILGTTFYLAVALQPRTGPAGVDLGFVVIDGRSVQVTADMLYGVPPVERGGAASFDPGDLARHDVYETFFLEVPFRFDVRHRSRLYDTRQHAGQGPLAGLGLLDRGFRIDVSHLAPGYDLHFDLYDEQVRRGDVDAGHFAPFDHDASTARVPVPTSVPEPGTVSLVAIGLLAGGAGRRRRPAPEACAKASNAFL
jgi:PEP-CTERM motif